MIFSKKHKFIFIHIPKTGGTSIWKSLLDVGAHIDAEVHMGAVKFKNRVGEKRWNEYFKFAFVRNPWDRMLSCYFYDAKNHSPSCQEGNFSKYLHYRLIEQPEIKKEKLFYRILDRIKLDGKIAVDFIGRYEKLQDDFNYICDTIGIPRRQLGHERKTIHKHYSNYYTDKDIALVSRIFKEEIEMFNYEF